jgi:mono/diheme cytochrome c family protein
MRRVMSAIALIVCSSVLVPAAGAQPPGDAAKGKQIFMRDHCYACHGTQGAGGGIAGPALAPNLPPFEAVLMQLRDPADRMPQYTDRVLSDAEAADIFAYLTSVPPDRPAAQIPLLNANPVPQRTPGPGSSHARHSARHR